MKTKGNVQFSHNLEKIDLQIYIFLAGIAAIYLAMYQLVGWPVGLPVTSFKVIMHRIQLIEKDANNTIHKTTIQNIEYNE